MKVREFLNKYNVGRGSVMEFVVVDTKTSPRTENRLSLIDVAGEKYGDCGDMSLNSFSINADCKRLTIFAQ